MALLNWFAGPAALLVFGVLLPGGLLGEEAATTQGETAARMPEQSLLMHLETNAPAHLEAHDLRAEWLKEADSPTIRLTDTGREFYSWVTLHPPKDQWSLGRRSTVEAQVHNPGTRPVNVMMWVVGRRGWDAVLARAEQIPPGETVSLRCQLREGWRDSFGASVTPKIDPHQVKHIQVMLWKTQLGDTVDVSDMVAKGEEPEWQRPAGRLDVPEMEDADPAAGRRVRFRLEDDQTRNVYCALYLPTDWKPGGQYPVVAEYPGNIFFDASCYSTGMPEQCAIGYGMTKGRGAIWVSLPFVKDGAVAENGFGDGDATADYALRVLDVINAKFGGEPNNAVITGFSRGAMACWYIGLRNERIAAVWRGFHAVQGYDGGGWGGSTRDAALERCMRIGNREFFLTDNPKEEPARMLAETHVQTTAVRSGLGAHGQAMFLDDRPSTLQLRTWFARVSEPGASHRAASPPSAPANAAF